MQMVMMGWKRPAMLSPKRIVPSSDDSRIPPGGTRRVRLVRKEGRDVSSWYGREGGGDAAQLVLFRLQGD